MKEIKRAVCLMLCFVMAFGLLPVHANALDLDVSELQPGEFVEEIIAGDALEEPLDPTATFATNTGTGKLVSEKVYTLDTDGVSTESKYLIVNNKAGSGYALTNNNGEANRTAVKITNNTITVSDDTNIAWAFSSSTNGNVSNNGRYLYPNYGSLDLNTTPSNLNIGNQNAGAYRIYRTSGSYNYFVTYSNYNWTGGSTKRERDIKTVYLYELTSESSGEKVTFTVNPGSTNLAPNGKTDLTSSVVVTNGNDVDVTIDLSDCTIEWSSSNDHIATVSNGTVTGVANGDATITATLSEVAGTRLEEAITVTISVKVTTRTVTSGKLLGDTHVTTKLNVEPDFSGIKLQVTYDDGSTALISNGLQITGYDITKIGSSYATVSYNGKDYGTIRVTVEGNPYAGLDEATVYPEYPADGAVRIDKTAKELEFASTGLVQVELDVAGVSVKGAVDVILVTDLSNSMAWKAGSRTDASSHADTKMADLAASVNTFATIFLANEEDGSATRNTLSLVTFGGYDKDHTNKVYSGYADPTQTLVLGTKDAATIENTINNIRVLADDALNRGTSSTGYYLSFDGGKTYGENYGNTNYDHAFMQTADAIAALKKAYEDENEGTYAESGRQIFVIFMTDGAPSNYDGVYYNYKTGDRADVNCTWINENGDEVTYTMGNNRAQYQAGPWFQYIAGGTYNTNTDSIPGNPLYWADKVYNTPGVADIIGVGFDLDNGGFSSMTFTKADGRPLSKVLEKLVTGKTLTVHSADDKKGMEEIYDKLATKLRYAGTSAQTTDIIDPDFTLQMDTVTGTIGMGIGRVDITEMGYAPSITIKTYDLVTKADLGKTVVVNGLATTVTQDMVGNIYKVDGKDVEIQATQVGTTILLDDQTVTVTEAHLGMRKNTAPTAIETITFETDVDYEEVPDEEPKEIRTIKAYSDLIANGKENIYSNVNGTVTIEAEYFTFTKTPEGIETFKWNIGNITDKEIALSYFAYLKGSLEGKEPDGLKYTNEEAILEYIDINGDYAKQIFPIPAVAWGGASTSYEFYLVNDSGLPCDREGNEIPFANRIIITGPYFQELYLNQSDEEIAQEIIAVKVLPAGYTLYDDTAKYTVQTASGKNQGSLTISKPAAGKVQTTKLVSAVTPSYIQSRVAFGVMYNEIPKESPVEIAPDAVVIDYGKEIIIDVNANNPTDTEGYSVDLIGFSKFYPDIDVTKWFDNTVYSTPFEGTYGTFSITDNGMVSYVPHKMVNNVGQIFCVYRLTKGSDMFYMVSELDVIPATVMYYETDFATGVFTTNTTWETKSEGEAADGPQNDGTIGHNTYGFDSTYDNDAYLSNGSSLFAAGQGYDEKNQSKTYATFSFTGTGFDLISRTGAAQGLIRVKVFTDAKMTNIERDVSVLNKSESNLELYQIPVVSINDLPHSTYYVKIEVDAAFTNTILPALNRGNEFYFDAIRIYDPVMGNAIAEAAYNADGEANNELDEVRAMLLNADTYATIQGVTTGMVFIDRTQTDVTVADYASIGPNNEVYLSKNQAVAFKVNANSIPASFDIGAKSITGSTAGLKVAVYDSQKNLCWTVTKDKIESSTVQFIDLLSATGVDASQIYKGAYVVITNTGDGVLSITDLKTAFSVGVASVEVDAITGVSTMSNGKMVTPDAVKPVEPFCVSYTVDAYTLDVARMVLTGDEEPEVPEVPETPEKPETPDVDPSFYNIQNVLIKINGSVKNQKCTFTVVTSQKVEDIEIVQNGAELMPARSSFKDKKSGERVWTIELRIGTYDKNGIFTLTGIGESGVRGASVTVNYMKNR